MAIEQKPVHLFSRWLKRLWLPRVSNPQLHRKDSLSVGNSVMELIPSPSILQWTRCHSINICSTAGKTPTNTLISLFTRRFVINSLVKRYDTMLASRCRLSTAFESQWRIRFQNFIPLSDCRANCVPSVSHPKYYNSAVVRQGEYLAILWLQLADEWWTTVLGLQEILKWCSKFHVATGWTRRRMKR